MSAWVKKSAQYVIFLGIGLGLLYLTFINVNPVDLWEDIKDVSIEGLLGVIAIGFLAIIFRGLRWVQMLQSLGYEVRGSRAIAAVCLSYLVNLVTPRVGEVVRCTALNKTDDVPIDKLLGTVVLERIVDTLLFATVVISTLLISNEELSSFLAESDANLPELQTSTIVLILIALILAVTAIYITRTHWKQWAIVQKIKAFVSGMFEGLRSLRKVKNKPLFWFYSVGIWTCYVATIAVGFTIMNGLESVGPEQAFFVSVAAGLGFVIPIPGGIGAYHYLVSKALVVLGLEPGLGKSFAALIHGSQSLMFVITGALGFVFLYFAGRK